MSLFALIMFGVAGYFAYQIYRHIQTLEDQQQTIIDVTPLEAKPKEVNDLAHSLLEEADESYKEGDLERAWEKLSRANEMRPNSCDILNRCAFVQAALGNKDHAIALYLQSLNFNDEDDLIHNAIASVYKAQEEFATAQEHYEKALRIDAEYAVTYYNYGNLLVAMDRTSDAVQMYHKALALQADFPQASDALAELKNVEKTKRSMASD